MPTVPGIPMRSVSPDNLPNARLSADTFGADVAAPVLKGIDANADASAEISLRAKRVADQVAHLDADTSQGTYDNQASVAFKQRKGKDAAAAYPDAIKAYDDNSQAIEKTLTNETQKIAFRASSKSRRDSFERFALGHVAAEGQAYDLAQSQANVKNSMDAISLMPDDWRNVEKEIGNIERVVKDSGTRNGLPPEAIEQKRAEAVSQARSTVVENLLAAGKTADAKAYFHTAGEDIVGDDRTKLTRAIEIGTDKDQARHEADTITDKYIDDPDGYGKAMAEARNISDTNVYDQTVNRIEENFRMHAKAKTRYVGNLNAAAFSAIENGKDVDPVTMQKLEDLGQAKRVRDYQASIAKGVEREDDEFTFNEAWAMADSDDPAQQKAFREKNWNEESDHLSKASLQALIKHQGIKKKEHQTNVRGAESLNSEVVGRVADSVMFGLGNDVHNTDDRKDPDKARQRMAFRKALDSAVLRQQKVKEQPIHQEEIEKLATELIAPSTWMMPADPDTLVVNKSRWDWSNLFSGPGAYARHQANANPTQVSGMRYENPNQNGALVVDDISAGDRALVEAALRESNVPVTEANIMASYNATRGGKR